MTAESRFEPFGPYAFTLTPGEAEAAAARAGLRLALRGGLLTRHLAPLAAFALVVVFASVLALTGLIPRRAGEATIILAGAAFMIQRLANHWRIRRARRQGRAAIDRLQSAGSLAATFGEDALSLSVEGRIERRGYAECEEAEDAGGLIYVWLREGVPIVVPTRALASSDEAARFKTWLSARIDLDRGAGKS